VWSFLIFLTVLGTDSTVTKELGRPYSIDGGGGVDWATGKYDSLGILELVATVGGAAWVCGGAEGWWVDA
jgi:hypothetical protein